MGVTLFFDMGAAAYTAKIEQFAAGDEVQQLLAKSMTLDPVSQWLVDGLRSGSW